MRIRVLFYFLDAKGKRESEVELEVTEEETCEHIVQRLKDLYDFSVPSLERCFFAKNGAYANLKTDFEEGDELLILPPVNHALFD